MRGAHRFRQDPVGRVDQRPANEMIERWRCSRHIRHIGNPKGRSLAARMNR